MQEFDTNNIMLSHKLWMQNNSFISEIRTRSSMKTTPAFLPVGYQEIWINLCTSVIHFCVQFPLVQILITLNLSDITSKFRSAAIIINIYMRKIFNTECIGLHLVCLHAKFQTPSFNGSLVIAVSRRLKADFARQSCFSFTVNKNYQSNRNFF